MKTHEPKCIALKRLGAKHVSQLLSGKTRKEQLEFWKKRSEKMLLRQKQEKITSN